MNPFTSANGSATTNAICKKWPTLKAYTTGSDKARLDTVFTMGNKVKAVAEVKKRKFDYQQQQAYGSTLIEWSKYEYGKKASIALGVPFLVIVELTDATMMWKVTDNTGADILPIQRTTRNAQVSEMNKTKVPKDCVLFLNKFATVL